MYHITYVKQAERSLRQLPKNIISRIQDKWAIIAEDPYGRHNNVAKLKDREEYRLRVGDWRVIYEIHDIETGKRKGKTAVLQAIARAMNLNDVVYNPPPDEKM